ncbi:MAG: hypothetical protein WD875_09285 [Pirellulales bacterium]
MTRPNLRSLTVLAALSAIVATVAAAPRQSFAIELPTDAPRATEPDDVPDDVAATPTAPTSEIAEGEAEAKPAAI